MVRTYAFNPSISTAAVNTLPLSSDASNRSLLLQQLHAQYTKLVDNSESGYEAQLMADNIAAQLELSRQAGKHKSCTNSVNEPVGSAKPPRPPSQHQYLPVGSPIHVHQHHCCCQPSTSRLSPHNSHSTPNLNVPPNQTVATQTPPLLTPNDTARGLPLAPAQLSRRSPRKGARYRELARPNTKTYRPGGKPGPAPEPNDSYDSEDDMIGLSDSQNNQYNRAAARQQQTRLRAELQRQINERQVISKQNGRNAYDNRPPTTYEDYWLGHHNRQPLTGIRGSPLWHANETNIASLYRQNSLPLGNFPTPTNSRTNSYSAGLTDQRNGALSPFRSVQSVAAQEKMSNGIDTEYNPFGKGGGGAPIRDSNGRMITDRRRMKGAWTKEMDTNRPHDYEFNSSSVLSSHSRNGRGPTTTSYDYGQPTTNYTSNYPSYSGPSHNLPSGNTIDSYSTILGGLGNTTSYQTPSYRPTSSHVIKAAGTSERDTYKQSLLEQIEEKRRIQAAENEKIRLQEQRDRERFEREQARIKNELDEEKRRSREKAAELERKRELAAEKARQDQIERDRQAGSNRRGGAPAPNDGLEWWERQPGHARPVSRAINTGRNLTNSRVHEKSPDIIRRRRRNVFDDDDTYDRWVRSDTSHGTGRYTQDDFDNRPVTNAYERPHERNYDDQYEYRDTYATRGGASRTAAANPAPRGTIDTFDTMVAPTQPKPKSRAKGRRRSVESGRNSYKPSSATRRNEGALRQLSATRERLHKEQARLRHALNANDYNEDVFSDDDEHKGALNGRRFSFDDTPGSKEKGLMSRSERLLGQGENDSLSAANDPFSSYKGGRSKPGGPLDDLLSDDD